MQKLSRLRHSTPHPAASFTTEENNYDDHPQVAKHGLAANPTTRRTAAAPVVGTSSPSPNTRTGTTMQPIGQHEGRGMHGLPAPLIAASSRRQSLSLEGGHDDDERGCMDAVSAFLLAIASVPPAVNKPESQEVGGVLPQLLRATKGAGTIESRDSARDLLRFFGHSPVLHLEAVVWIKASGERVHCIAALSNWSLFIVPFRNPASIGGIIHSFYQAKQNTFARIVEIPLRSIVDVAMVSARESLHTFANFEVNWVSRPFRIVTTATCHSSGPIEAGASKCDTTAVSGNESTLTLVGFEAICRLRHLLVMACESWTVRDGAARSVPVAGMVSCAPTAAQRYLDEVYKAMTGPLRNQVDAQVEIMEDLADEMILDTVLKDAFFSTGDIYFELARRLQRSSAEAAAAAVAPSLVTVAAVAAAAAAAAAPGQKVLVEGRKDGNLGGGQDSRRSAGVDARLLSATAAVFDAAFFHSMQLPQKMDIFMLSTPMALPKIAETLVRLYCNEKRRWLSSRGGGGGGSGGGGGGSGGGGGGGGGDHGGDEHIGEDSRQDLCTPSSRTPLEEYDAGGERTRATDDKFSRRRKRTLDCVVRALNGISDAVILFNVEHEHLGIVRNLVGVGLGSAWRAGVQPAASDALGFLVAVNDRVVCLIEELDQREQEQRQLDNTNPEQHRGILSAAQEMESGGRGGGKKKKGTPFFRRTIAARVSGKRSPGYRSSKSQSPPTRPSTLPSSRSPPESPGSPEPTVKTKPPIDDARRGAKNKSLRPPRPTLDKNDVRLHRLLEGDRPENNGEAETATPDGRTATDGVNSEVGENRASGARGRVGRAPSSSSPSSSPVRCLHAASPREFLSSAPVLLHSYAKLLNALVCGSYNLRAAFSSSCEADLRNIRRKGGYLDVLAGLDDGAPRKVFREAARFLHEILIECDCR